MSTPPGPGPYEHGQNVDPITGQPTGGTGGFPSQPGGYQGLGAFPNTGGQQQQSQQGFGQGGYQGLGAFQQEQGGHPGYVQPGGPPQPFLPRKRNTALIVAGVFVLVAAVAVGVILFVVNKKPDNNATPAGQSSSVAVTTTRSTPRTTTSTSSQLGASTQPKAITPGYQGVLSVKENVLYDVPPDWKVETSGTIRGYEYNTGDHKPRMVLHGSATYKLGACGGDQGTNRGFVGFTTAGTADPGLVARNAAKLWAEAAGADKEDKAPSVTLSDPQPVDLAGGEVKGTLVTGSAPVLDQSGKCPSPSVQVVIVSFKNGETTGCFTMVMDSGVPDALPGDVTQKIIASIRYAEGPRPTPTSSTPTSN